MSDSEDSSLLNFISEGGKFYAECTGFFTQSGTILWNDLGLKLESEDQLFDYYDTIECVDSEFTTGLRIPQLFGEAFE